MGEHSTTTTNLDAPLLRLMLSLATAQEITWPSGDITSAFLNADIHEDETALVTPPPILAKMNIVMPNTVWHVKKAIYGLREAPRLWQGKTDQQLRDLEFVYQDEKAYLVQSHIHSGHLLDNLESHPLIIPCGAMSGQSNFMITEHLAT